jgi:hypothetical protein
MRSGCSRGGTRRRVREVASRRTTASASRRRWRGLWSRRFWGSESVSTIGELSDFGVADLIECLTKRGRTGRLAVKAAGEEVHLYFESGRLVMISSTDITLRLGRMLIRQGLLDTPRLLEGLHAQSETGNKKPLGAILIERGWVTEPDLVRCVEEQSIEAMARAVTEQPGLFVFDGDATRPAHVETVPLDPGVLLQAAYERTDAIRLLKEQLPAPGTPLFLNAAMIDLPNILDELGAPETMVASVLRTGAKSYTELSFHLALDELTLGVAVLTLLEAGAIMTSNAPAASQGRVAIRA